MLQIDWSNPGFIKLYCMVFALATIFTCIAWLIAIVKRVAREVNPAAAIAESIGSLLLSVIVTAFAPAIIATVVDLVDEMAVSMFKPFLADMTLTGAFIVVMLGVLSASAWGLPIALALIGFFLTVGLGLFLMLVARNALVLTGVVFGPVVFAGLVDRDLWGHSKKYIGVITGIIMSKWVMMVVLAMIPALFGSTIRNPPESFSRVVSTLLIILALFIIAGYAPWQVSKFIPMFGDEIQNLAQHRDIAMQKGKDAWSKARGSNSNDEMQDKNSSGAGDLPRTGYGSEAEPGSGTEAAAAGESPAGLAAVGAEKTEAKARGAEEGVRGAVGKGFDSASMGSDGAGSMGDGEGMPGGSGSGPEGGPDQPGGPGGMGGTPKPGGGGRGGGSSASEGVTPEASPPQAAVLPGGEVPPPLPPASEWPDSTPLSPA
ncbi:hypothetical protein JCM4814A_01060 [Streptomyces phaeofaciens JCM 4814]|uniref:Integral membrane protein n=1 Tax=Streptomyces phaeofaciens TaxID=68254 RepID=A0A918HPL8_9ACTN|nr:hypothetical protein [Streptomyces phaeofaciens]GGT92041.1 hypothetical protein GCM10010226_82520 [Streptomyces phaeofaciens]